MADETTTSLHYSFLLGAEELQLCTIRMGNKTQSLTNNLPLLRVKILPRKMQLYIIILL